jgi:hypothetical protein
VKKRTYECTLLSKIKTWYQIKSVAENYFECSDVEKDWFMQRKENDSIYNMVAESHFMISNSKSCNDEFKSIPILYTWLQEQTYSNSGYYGPHKMWVKVKDLIMTIDHDGKNVTKIGLYTSHMGSFDAATSTLLREYIPGIMGFSLKPIDLAMVSTRVVGYHKETKALGVYAYGDVSTGVETVQLPSESAWSLFIGGKISCRDSLNIVQPIRIGRYNFESPINMFPKVDNLSGFIKKKVGVDLSEVNLLKVIDRCVNLGLHETATIQTSKDFSKSHITLLTEDMPIAPQREKVVERYRSVSKKVGGFEKKADVSMKDLMTKAKVSPSEVPEEIKEAYKSFVYESTVKEHYSEFAQDFLTIVKTLDEALVSKFMSKWGSKAFGSAIALIKEHDQNVLSTYERSFSDISKKSHLQAFLAFCKAMDSTLSYCEDLMGRMSIPISKVGNMFTRLAQLSLLTDYLKGKSSPAMLQCMNLIDIVFNDNELLEYLRKTCQYPEESSPNSIVVAKAPLLQKFLFAKDTCNKLKQWFHSILLNMFTNPESMSTFTAEIKKRHKSVNAKAANQKELVTAFESDYLRMGVNDLEEIFPERVAETKYDQFMTTQLKLFRYDDEDDAYEESCESESCDYFPESLLSDDGEQIGWGSKDKPFEVKTIYNARMHDVTTHLGEGHLILETNCLLPVSRMVIKGNCIVVHKPRTNPRQVEGWCYWYIFGKEPMSTLKQLASKLGTNLSSLPQKSFKDVEIAYIVDGKKIDTEGYGWLRYLQTIESVYRRSGNDEQLADFTLSLMNKDSVSSCLSECKVDMSDNYVKLIVEKCLSCPDMSVDLIDPSKKLLRKGEYKIVLNLLKSRHKEKLSDAQIFQKAIDQISKSFERSKLSLTDEPKHVFGDLRKYTLFGKSSALQKDLEFVIGQKADKIESDSIRVTSDEKKLLQAVTVILSDQHLMMMSNNGSSCYDDMYHLRCFVEQILSLSTVDENSGDLDFPMKIAVLIGDASQIVSEEARKTRSAVLPKPKSTRSMVSSEFMNRLA